MNRVRSEVELLQNHVNGLRSRLAHHRHVIAQWQAKADELWAAPVIPLGATSQQLAEIFESRSGFDDEIAGILAATAELQRREAALAYQLQTCIAELQRWQEQESRAGLKQSVLSAIGLSAIG